MEHINVWIALIIIDVWHAGIYFGRRGVKLSLNWVSALHWLYYIHSLLLTLVGNEIIKPNRLYNLHKQYSNVQMSNKNINSM